MNQILATLRQMTHRKLRVKLTMLLIMKMTVGCSFFTLVKAKKKLYNSMTHQRAVVLLHILVRPKAVGSLVRQETEHPWLDNAMQK